MADQQTLHIFHVGNLRTFGYTEDRSGKNLPHEIAPQGWRYHSTIEVRPGEGPRAGVNVDDIQAEIRKAGFCVKTNVVSVEVLASRPAM